MKTRIKKIPETLLAHPMLSFGAKGLFAFINSKDIEWKGNEHIISCESKNTEEDIQAYTLELLSLGYMTTAEEPTEAGERLYTYTLIENRSAGRRQQIKDSIIKIVAYWNTFGIVVHTKTAPSLEAQIERTLETYTIEEIYKSIENYSAVFKSKLTWWTHKWTLEEFLKRQNGMGVFLYKGEVDYIDKVKAQTDPRAKALIAQKTVFVKKQEEIAEAEKKKHEQEKKLDKEELKKFWKTLSPESKAHIEKKVAEVMSTKQSLKENMPQAYTDFEMLARMNATNELKESLYATQTSG